RLGVNLIRDHQPFAAGLGEANHLFEPSGTRRFDVQTGVMLFNQAIDNWVNRKLVAAQMDAELEGIRQPKFADGEGDDAQILVKLPLELREIPNVIDPFIKPSSKLWGDRLDRYPFLGDHRQDQEQLHRVLRRVSFVD